MGSIICKNCGAALEAKFYSQCGQKKQTRILLRQVGSDVYNGMFDFDSPFLKTFV
jgi:transcription elongation factor Elf1